MYPSTIMNCEQIRMITVRSVSKCQFSAWIKKIKYRFSRSIQNLSISLTIQIYRIYDLFGKYVCIIRTRYFPPDYAEYYVVIEERSYLSIYIYMYIVYRFNMGHIWVQYACLVAAFTHCHAITHRYGLFRLLEPACMHARTYIHTLHRQLRRKKSIINTVYFDGAKKYGIPVE